jgi:hypothetical protein
MKAFRKNFRAKAPLDFTGASDDAYRLIDEFEAELATMEVSAAKLNELEDLFEIKPVSTYVETADTRVEVRLLKEVWDARGLVEHSFEKWKTALWKEIDTDSLLVRRLRARGGRGGRVGCGCCIDGAPLGDHARRPCRIKRSGSRAQSARWVPTTLKSRPGARGAWPRMVVQCVCLCVCI